MSQANPRRLAFEILLRIDKERSYADILLDQALSRDDLHGPDRGLLTELVYGVLRRQGTLDHVISQFSTTKLAKLERAVLILLRLGLYQELFLDRVPVSAAVNETVKLAKVATPRAAGFVNAVLRQADRERTGIRYPERDKEPARFLAARYSHPEWLAQRWIGQLGTDEAEQLAEAMSAPPPLTLRANTLKISREELVARLKTAGIAATATDHAPDGIRLGIAAAPSRLPGFQEGLFTVQDESSQLAALLLDPKRGESVFDLCAAPGGKATYLAQLMGNEGHVLAGDLGERKLRLILATAARLGISIVETVAVDASKPLGEALLEGFDRVLVDAPCSGLGVLRRHPEGKWWKRPEDVSVLALTQKAILENGANCLKNGGVLLYATCSTSPEENENVIDEFISRRTDFVLEDLREVFPKYEEFFTAKGVFRSWPHRHSMDGFFAARMKKLQ